MIFMQESWVGTVGRMPKGEYSPRGCSGHPSGNPLLRTASENHSQICSLQNAWQAPLLRALPRARSPGSYRTIASGKFTESSPRTFHREHMASAPNQTPQRSSLHAFAALIPFSSSLLLGRHRRRRLCLRSMALQSPRAKLRSALRDCYDSLSHMLAVT